ncbi:lipoprotein [Dyella caseinilytica]|nr:lipoprotein [Dyella caseinilytica]
MAGCVTNSPVQYRGLDSTAQLTPNLQSQNTHIPLYYSVPDAHLSKYTQVILDTVTVYDGEDQQFGKLSATERQQLAGYMQMQFSQTLGKKYVLTSAPGPDTLRIHLTLTGASASVPVLSTVKQILPVGAVLGTLKSAADSPSRSLGSVTYAVEIYNSQSNQLLRAFVAKQYPAAENISASLGTLSAAETGIEKGAKTLLTQLE